MIYIINTSNFPVLTYQIITIKLRQHIMAGTSLLGFVAKSFIIFFVIITLPITYFCKIYVSIVQFLFQIIWDNFHQLWPMKFINKAFGLFSNSKKDQFIEETPQLPFLSPRTKENRIKNILQEAAASPNEQTCNQKVLLLRQKMAILQERVVEESRMKRKVEQELFQINIKMIEKNAQICQQRNRNIKSLRQSEMLQMQLTNKQQQLEELEEMIHFLEEEANALKIKTKEYEENLDSTIE